MSFGRGKATARATAIQYPVRLWLHNLLASVTEPALVHVVQTGIALDSRVATTLRVAAFAWLDRPWLTPAAARACIAVVWADDGTSPVSDTGDTLQIGEVAACSEQLAGIAQVCRRGLPRRILRGRHLSHVQRSVLADWLDAISTSRDDGSQAVPCRGCLTG